MYNKEKNPVFELQKNTKNIRNFCILAHVDHGKTTLADTLLASNGIISSRMSGKLRYMDSRQDEQERGITMKSSAISLIHKNLIDNQHYLINLIDSPGHVDFSTEVSTAVRLCDGAAILIDVCEGICPQTHAVLRQASLENLKLILILNKIDRLILELKMTPSEAYSHLVNILGQFNALVAQQFTSLICEKNDRLSDNLDGEENVEWADDIDESKLYFSPKYNNVFFASAIDGWGFGIKNFADIYSAKLGFKREILIETLWGDYFLNAKTKRIMKDAQKKGKKPLFVQFVLDNIWQVYDSVYIRRDTLMTEKILESLKIKLAPRELKFTDPKGPLQALFINWLPLGRNLLDMIVETLPSPLEMSSDKVEHLICNKLKSFKSLPKETQNLKNDFINCSPDTEKPVIVFISKMFAAEKDSIVKKRQLTAEDIELKREAIRQKKKHEEEIRNNPELIKTEQKPKEPEPEPEVVEEAKQEFLAFARVFSGTLKKGQNLFILSPKHNTEDFIGKNIDINSTDEEIAAISKHIIKFTVNDIYLMMGRELELIDEVPCGNIVAIGSLENLVLKSATLSSTLFCPSFTGMYLQTSPIVRVAIEPKNPSKMKELTKGLRLLNQSDPCVEIYVQENGEHILCTAGEVHLQRCIDDLVQRFALIPVNVSPPIIPFRETIVYVNAKDRKGLCDSGHLKNQLNESKDSDQIGPDGLVEMHSNDKRITIWLKAKPLPTDLTKFLEDNVQSLKLLTRLNQNKINVSQKESIDALVEFKTNFENKLLSLSGQGNNEGTLNCENILNKIVCFGPNKYGPNILVNMMQENDEDEYLNVWSILDSCVNRNIAESMKSLEISPKSKNNNIFNEYENSITFGFNLFAAKGPICEEPVQGVAIIIEKFQIDEFAIGSLNESNNSNNNESLNYNEVTEEKKVQTKVHTTQCISLMKEACKRSFEAQPQRLMAAMYKCEIMTVNSEALGKLYAVLGKRNAKILDESMKDATSMFIITALIPVADSFGLAEEIRKRTSGLASPHIEFSHFETIEIDPSWEPKTEEELELFGDKADFENQARKYMNEVRKRKGLFVREKIVEHSEKQRTLIKD